VATTTTVGGGDQDAPPTMLSVRGMDCGGANLAEFVKSCAENLTKRISLRSYGDCYQDGDCYQELLHKWVIPVIVKHFGSNFRCQILQKKYISPD
jgi:hypothetical protein